MDSLFPCTSNTVGKLCFTIKIRIILDLVMLVYSELYLLLIQIAQQNKTNNRYGLGIVTPPSLVCASVKELLVHLSTRTLLLRGNLPRDQLLQKAYWRSLFLFTFCAFPHPHTVHSKRRT